MPRVIENDLFDCLIETTKNGVIVNCVNSPMEAPSKFVFANEDDFSEFMRDWYITRFKDKESS